MDDIVKYMVHIRSGMGSSGRVEPINRSGRFMQNPWERYSPQKEAFMDVGNVEREMERVFQEQFREIESKAPKELVREYETQQEGRVKEIGPIIYGYSVTISSNGKPTVREFGNIRSSPKNGPNILSSITEGEFTSVREPLDNIVTSDRDIRIVIELPGVQKEDISIHTYEESIEVDAGNGNRKYKRLVEIPSEWDIESAKATFKNSILEISFDKLKKHERKGKQIKIG